jgi:hypothetical protein
MIHYLSPWVCRDCRKQYDGYGSYSKTDPNYGVELICEKCHRKVWLLVRFRIPDEPIRFEFVSSYRWWASYRVVIGGVDQGYTIEYHGKPDIYVPGVWNYTPEEYKRFMTDMENCIDVRNDPEREIPDNVLEAFRIFYDNYTIQRKKFVHDGWFDEIDQKVYPDCHVHSNPIRIDGYFINSRMDAY